MEEQQQAKQVEKLLYSKKDAAFDLSISSSAP
jgi:hypothetical protein